VAAACGHHPRPTFARARRQASADDWHDHRAARALCRLGAGANFPAAKATDCGAFIGEAVIPPAMTARLREVFVPFGEVAALHRCAHLWRQFVPLKRSRMRHDSALLFGEAAPQGLRPG
jgi:hypothetical protein